MIIGTTPTFTLRVTDDDTLDFTSVEKIYFTIRQGSVSFTKTGEDILVIDEHTIAVTFTQEETLAFKYNLTAEIQLNWLYENNVRAATRVKTINLSKNLIREVLE